jgi:hypothetical protein
MGMPTGTIHARVTKAIQLSAETGYLAEWEQVERSDQGGERWRTVPGGFRAIDPAEERRQAGAHIQGPDNRIYIANAEYGKTEIGDVFVLQDGRVLSVIRASGSPLEGGEQ